MADQAVDFCLIGEVKGGFLPTKSGMATGTAGPVAGEVYKKIIDGFTGLAQVDALLVAFGKR